MCFTFFSCIWSVFISFPGRFVAFQGFGFFERERKLIILMGVFDRDLESGGNDGESTNN